MSASDLPERMMLAARLAGVATQRMRAGRLEDASRALDLARAVGAEGFRLRMACARFAILGGDAPTAIAELTAARELDPFDEDAADLLAQLHAKAGDELLALECLVDARALAADVDPARGAEYDAQVESLLHALGIDDPGERKAFLEGRRERLDELAARFERQAEELSEPGDGGGEPASLALLRGIPFFARLSDRELERLQATVVRRRVPAGRAVFREGQPSEDVYVVETGRVVIQRETPFGPQELATVGPGAIFGEMNFIDGLSRSADALASEDSTILRLSHEALKGLFAIERHVALRFLEEFWRALSEKVREGNELMRTFFPEGGPPPAPKEDASEGEAAGVDAGVKAGLLQEKGLTGHDLEVLAEHAQAVKYEAGQAVFREGDAGDDLCIVLDGKVRIEKSIPGVGQEALAILERGDFFGEMAVIDRAARSASAVAHEGGATVLRIRRDQIDALLGSGAESAHELLLILCRILSSRLRENNDKIVQWRMMSGGF